MKIVSCSYLQHLTRVLLYPLCHHNRLCYRIRFPKTKPPQFYDHRTAEFVPLDEPEIQKVRTEPSNPKDSIYNYIQDRKTDRILV
jgi:hypothetical protein